MTGCSGSSRNRPHRSSISRSIERERSSTSPSAPTHVLLGLLPSGKLGFWQIAFRDPADGERRALLDAVEQGSFGAEVLYGDYEGGQRVVTRFSVLRENGAWQLSAVRHWQVDRPGPR